MRIPFLLLSAALIAVDQITKHMAVTVLRDSRPVVIIPGLLEFTYLENAAAAMGMFGGMIGLVMIVCVLVAAGIAVGIFIYDHHTWASYASATLLLAGGIGNLIDRITNLGPDGERFVVDFIHVKFFPYVFNFADCCITVGAVLMVVHFIISAWREKKPVGQNS